MRAYSDLFTSSSFASVENANFLSSRGIISDKSKNISEYRLNSNILRQEAAVVALGIFGGKPENFCKGIFLDVSESKPNSWACKTIEALEKYDIISDDNAYFRPEAKITKAEVLGMLIEAGLDEEYDYDRKNSHIKGNWQKQVVDFAVSKGIVKNFSDYNSFATRDFVFDIGANILKYKEGILKNISENTNQANNISKNISQNEAKNIALKKAGLNENQTYGLIVKNDYERGVLFYEVEFFQINTRKKWEYKINSTNGQIAEFDIDYNDFD